MMQWQCNVYISCCFEWALFTLSPPRGAQADSQHHCWSPRLLGHQKYHPPKLNIGGTVPYKAIFCGDIPLHRPWMYIVASTILFDPTWFNMIQPSPNYPYISILSAGGDAQQSHCKSCISQSIGFHQVHLRSLRSLGSLRVFQYLPIHQRSINVSWGKKRISIHSSAWQSCVQSRTQRESTCVFGQGPRHSPALRTTSNLMFEQFELDQENTRNGIAALNFCTGGILCCCACLHLWFAFLSRYPTLWQVGIFMYFRNVFFFCYVLSQKSACLMAERRLSRRSCNMPKSLSGLH